MCERMDLHAAHRLPKGQGQDFEKKVKKETREQLRIRRKRRANSKSDHPRPVLPPWKWAAPSALDHSIAKSVSKTYPKHLDAILDDVENDYGSAGSTQGTLYRQVQRHLTKLVERGQILRIDLGQRLYAYLRPGSTLVRDVDMMREQIIEMIEVSSDRIRATA